MVLNYPQQILRFLLDVIFPVSCISCGRFSANNTREYLCGACLKKIPIKKTFECIGCDKASRLGKTCFECTEYRNIDHLLTVSDYKNQLLEKVIKLFKYRFVKDMDISLRKLIKKYIYWLGKEKHFSLIADNPVIIPIPLHPRRLNWRGFNHAEAIAGLLSEITYANIENGILSRANDSKPQAEIQDREERLKNTRSIFKITNSSEIKGRTVILVDDVCTTGATLNEAAILLKKEGASKIIGFVIARG